MLGDVYVDSKVGNSVVAVLGDVVLGPNADVGGVVVEIGGTLKRDPAAIVRGGVQQIFAGPVVSFHWLRPWIEHCLLYGRPLAIAPGLGWAWVTALSLLALYVILRSPFPKASISACGRSRRTRDARSSHRCS